MVTLATDLKGVIARAAGPLRAARGIVTVADLLPFYPTRYLTYDSDLAGLVEGHFVVVVGEVKSVLKRPMSLRKGMMLNAILTDGAGNEVTMTFFNARGHEDKLRPGVRVIAGGQVTRFNRTFQLAHPGYTLLSELTEADLPGLYPLYPAVPRLHNWTLVASVKLVLDAIGELPDPVPDELRRRHGVPSLRAAVLALHRPDSRAHLERARKRMQYAEALVLQTVLARARLAREQESAQPRVAVDGAALGAFDERLPFTLTPGQQAVAAEIASDLAGTHPMFRLLQGDVGSGKTVLALRAMLTAVDAGAQAVLLAPTEVLATQHHRTITAMLGDLAGAGMLGGHEAGTSVVLLTGSLSQPQRRRALLDIAAGTAGIVIGTHALLQDAVSFADLALVVIDEQHRFGVEQRDVLRAKATTPPHVLVLTATPIPRTVAMTVFGDLDVSTLTELPAGRSPVTTHVVDDGWPPWVARTWGRVAEECRAGHAAYVVCPHIGDVSEPAGHRGAGGDSETGGSEPVGGDEELGGNDLLFDFDPSARPAAGVLATLTELRAEPALAGLRIECLHGRLPSEAKDALMAGFAGGEIDILVATTVIEVGVDVPRATVIVIRDADRFGVSQLHQLRGRVGRGGDPGLCLLMTGVEPGPARQRLEAVAATSDGFALARLDLEQRREGDVLGVHQSGGRRRLRFLSLLRHEDLIATARADAAEIVAADPELKRHPVLRAVAERWLEPEVAEFLEKG